MKRILIVLLLVTLLLCGCGKKETEETEETKERFVIEYRPGKHICSHKTAMEEG